MAVKKPLSGLLDDLLTPVDLAWRVIDERTVVITTVQDAAEHMELEFYPARDLAADAAAGQSMISQIAATVSPQLWGPGPEKAAMFFDAPGPNAYRAGAERVQCQVETLLTARRTQK